MYRRIFDVESKLDEAMFLYGARQTGKSTLLKERFKEEHPDCRLIMVSLDPVPRKVEDIELIPVLDFLRMLWNGEIF